MRDYYVRAEIEIRVRATCEDDASEKVKQDMTLGYGADSVWIKEVEEE